MRRARHSARDDDAGPEPSWVIDSIMHMNRLSRFWISTSLPLNMSEFMPGIMPMTCEIGPMFRMVWNCSYMSWSVNVPARWLGLRSRGLHRTGKAPGSWPPRGREPTRAPCSRLLIKLVFFSMFRSWTFSIRPLMSPMPAVAGAGAPRARSRSSDTVGRPIGTSAHHPAHAPSSLLTNGLASNFSRSWMCSPTPMKTIGLLVAATLEVAL